MKMVASGRGGWDVPGSSYEWQFKQMRQGRGILVFDDGWHKLATAIWLFGPIQEVRAWVGGTEVVPGIEIDAPTTIVVGARERDPGCVGHHPGPRHVPAVGLLHQRRALGGHRPPGLRPGQPVHRPGHPAAEPGGLRRRGDALLPRPRRRLGQQLPRLRPPLAAVAPHRGGPACCGAARRRWRCCASPWPPTPAARPAAPAWIRPRWNRAPTPTRAGRARFDTMRWGRMCQA